MLKTEWMIDVKLKQTSHSIDENSSGFKVSFYWYFWKKIKLRTVFETVSIAIINLYVYKWS